MRSARTGQSAVRMVVSLIPTPHASRGDRHGVAVPVVPDVGDRPAGSGDADAGGERPRGYLRFDRRIQALPAREMHDRLHGVLLGVVHDRVAPVLSRHGLANGHRLDTDDQPGTAESSADGGHQARRSLREHRHGTPDGDVRVLGSHEPGRQHVAAAGRLLVLEIIGKCHNQGAGPRPPIEWGHMRNAPAGPG